MFQMLRVALHAYFVLMLCSQAWAIPADTGQKMIQEKIGGVMYKFAKDSIPTGNNAHVYLGFNVVTGEPVVKKVLSLARDYSDDAIQAYTRAGLYIYHRKKVMIQRKIDGITLEEYLSKKIRNEDFSSTGSYYSHVQKQAFNQQENIGFWHRDAHDGNIMVNAQTGEFITLIDWDNARPLRRIL